MSSGSSFTASFYSTLNPGTTVPYSITGCSSADLSGAAVSGVLTAPYQSTVYSIAAGVAGRSIKFDVSGGTVVPTLYVPNVIYTVNVSGGVFWLATGGGAAVQQPSITLGAGLMYVFDQSAASNVGNTLVLGSYRDATPYYTTNVVINGTAGSADAFTVIDLSGQTLPSPALKYFSANISSPGMGHLTIPDAPTIISATAGNAFADISYSAPTNNGGSTITLYTVTVATRSGVIYSVFGSSFTSTSPPKIIKATGLTNGMTYYFSIFATNAVGQGAATQYADCFVSLLVPNEPTITYTRTTSTSTEVTFSRPANNGSAITSYTAKAFSGQYSNTVVKFKTGTTTTLTITGLSSSTSYFIEVTATNAVGDSISSYNRTQVITTSS